ncbi:MAG: lysophospholipid acyltransferase family protein [Chloroflexi bacterium]|nr:lysophospholipid acyltransferase family protein [Chloroflexota bacterium]
MGQWLFPLCNIGFKTTLKLFSDFEISGQENIPRSGPVLVASNHLSNLDPAIVAAALDRPPVFLAKKELFRYRVGAFLMRAYGAFPVDRRGADIRALKWITNQLTVKNRIAIVFPEGTRSKSGALLHGQAGLAHLASSTGVPIVPFGLTGSEHLQNPLRVVKPSGVIRLNIGKPFVVSRGAGRSTREVAATLTTEIMVRIARLLPEDKRGEYGDLLGTEMIKTVDFNSHAVGEIS